MTVQMTTITGLFCLLLFSGAVSANSPTCPIPETLPQLTELQGRLCLDEEGGLYFVAPASLKTMPAPEPCVDIAMGRVQGKPKNFVHLQATDPVSETRIGILAPINQDICLSLTPILQDRLRTIRQFAATPEDIDPYYYHEEIAFLSQDHMVISGHRGTHGLNGGIYPDARLMRKRDLNPIPLVELFLPGSLSLSDPDLVLLERVAPSLLEIVEARYLAQNIDPDCNAIVIELAPSDWHIAIHSEGLRFTPGLPSVAQYCTHAIYISADEAEPWLTPTGVALWLSKQSK